MTTPHMNTINRIKFAVSESFGQSSTMLFDLGNEQTELALYFSYTLAHYQFKISVNEIAMAFDKAPSSVLQGIKRTKNFQMFTDEVRTILGQISKNLKGESGATTAMVLA